jgi:predicted RNA-binding protein with PUA-like domain
MAMWLLKTEPEEYSWQDLVEEGQGVWDGVKAPAALKNLRRVKKGDQLFIYHTGQERAIVGIAKVTAEAYPDPSEDDGKLFVIKIAPVEQLRRVVSLKQIKSSGLFPDWDLIRLPRLSVVPVSKEQWDFVVSQSEPELKSE